MKLSSTRLFPLLLMVTLALLTFWLERTAREEPVQGAQPRHDPDYTVERFSITDFSREGAPVSTLSAVKMVRMSLLGGANGRSCVLASSLAPPGWTVT